MARLVVESGGYACQTGEQRTLGVGAERPDKTSRANSGTRWGALLNGDVRNTGMPFACALFNVLERTYLRTTIGGASSQRVGGLSFGYITRSGWAPDAGTRTWRTLRTFALYKSQANSCSRTCHEQAVRRATPPLTIARCRPGNNATVKNKRFLGSVLEVPTACFAAALRLLLGTLMNDLFGTPFVAPPLRFRYDRERCLALPFLDNARRSPP